MTPIFKGKKIWKFIGTIISTVMAAIIVAVILGDYKWESGRFVNKRNDVKEIDSRTDTQKSYISNNGPMTNSSERKVDPAAIEPIRKLFIAWENLDLDLYMNQWAIDGIQHSKSFKPRGYDEIRSNRQTLFSTLERVTTQYNIKKAEYTNQNTVSIDLQYSMSYYLLSGKVVHENNVLEKYLVVKDKNSGSWLIQSNYDYIE